MDNLEKIKNIKTKKELKDLINKDKSLKEEFIKDFLGSNLSELLKGVDLDDISIDF